VTHSRGDAAIAQRSTVRIAIYSQEKSVQAADRATRCVTMTSNERLKRTMRASLTRSAHLVE